MNSVFVLQFSHRLSETEDSTFLLGVYRSLETAMLAFQRYSALPGFRDHPRVVNPETDADDQGFYIDEYGLDQDTWTSGFATMRY